MNILKRYTLLLFALVITTSVNSQTVNELFAGYGSVGAVTGSNPYTFNVNNWVGNLRFQPDGTFDGTQVAIGDVIWYDCARMTITAVNSSGLFSFNVTATIDAGDVTLGVTPVTANQVVAVVREFNSGSFVSMPAFPPAADGNAGAQPGVAPSLLACMQNHYNQALLTGLTGLVGMPTALSANQIPVSTGASTTYTPRSLVASTDNNRLGADITISSTELKVGVDLLDMPRISNFPLTGIAYDLAAYDSVNATNKRIRPIDLKEILAFSGALSTDYLLTTTLNTIILYEKNVEADAFTNDVNIVIPTTFPEGMKVEVKARRNHPNNVNIVSQLNALTFTVDESINTTEASYLMEPYERITLVRYGNIVHIDR